MTAAVAGVCVFDLDGTLYKYKCKHDEEDGSCKQHLQAMITQCRTMGMGVGINTARFRISSRIKRHLLTLGLDVDALPRGAVQLRAYTPKRKARAMARIAATYGVRPESMLLYDNSGRNVRRVVEAGYKGVDVSRTGFVQPHLVFVH